jgi:hypothetical protein
MLGDKLRDAGYWQMVYCAAIVVYVDIYWHDKIFGELLQFSSQTACIYLRWAWSYSMYFRICSFRTQIPADSLIHLERSTDAQSGFSTRVSRITYLRRWIIIIKELSPSWEVANCAATQELYKNVSTPNVHYRVHKMLHWSISWARWIQSIPPHPISLRYRGCFEKNFTNLKAYINLYRGHTQRFELS